jgi:hypothetical protein
MMHATSRYLAFLLTGVFPDFNGNHLYTEARPGRNVHYKC